LKRKGVSIYKRKKRRKNVLWHATKERGGELV